jgi:L-threonylcarbamoyladenylate synthase
VALDRIRAVERESNLINRAAQILNRGGGLVIFPTDTAMALGCRIDDEAALKRLGELTGRPRNQPSPVLIGGADDLTRYLKPLPEEVEDLMKRHWPGGLTIVFWCYPRRVPSLVRGGGDTLGVRMPDHPVPRELIKKTGTPLVGTSANRHRLPTPYSNQELDHDLAGGVDLVIPGRCPLRMSSTVVDVTVRPWRILRQGAVKVKIPRF